jgi:flagellar motor switch protein FliN
MGQEILNSLSGFIFTMLTVGGKMEELLIENQQTGNSKKFELNLDSLLDIPVEISVEIGRTKMVIGELLSLSKGSIIELNKIAGESVDIYVNGKLLGKGEIVVVNERLGVRIMDIATPKERVQKLA